MKKEAPLKKRGRPAKAKQHSTESIGRPNSGRPNYLAYAGTYQLRRHPTPDAFKELVAQDLKEWAETTKDYGIEDFYDSKGIPPKTFYAWVKNFPPMKEAHAYAKRRLAAKLNRGAIEKKLDAQHVRFMLPHYGKQWKKTEEWRANLKKDANFGSGTIIVQVPEVPTSKMVPERKKDEEKES